MGKHCGTCICKYKRKTVYKEYPCEHCGTPCKRQQKRALCSLKCRLLGNIKKENGCFIWQGKIGIDGYGQIMINKKRQRVHRVSFETFKGSIPQGYLMCHTCDTPACINPKHLFFGTHEDNMYDMVKKGRSYNGGYRRMRTIKKINNDTNITTP